MSRIHTIGSIIIRVWGIDHLPPHFHIIVGEDSVAVDIATLQVIEGSIRGNDLRTALEWARPNIDRIRAEWNRLHPRFPVT